MSIYLLQRKIGLLIWVILVVGIIFAITINRATILNCLNTSQGGELQGLILLSLKGK